MSRYGAAMTGDPLKAQFVAQKAGEYTFKLYPQLWKSIDLANYYLSKKWTVVKFQKPAPSLPKKSGIYMFIVGPYCGGIQDHSYIFYIGKATNIKTRYRNYLDEKEGKGFNPRKEVVLFLNNFEDFLYFHFTEVPAAELDKAEKLLKDNLTPVANDQVAIIGRL